MLLQNTAEHSHFYAMVNLLLPDRDRLNEVQELTLLLALSSTSEKEVPSRQVVVTLLLCVNFEVLVGFEESATQLTVIGIK